MAQYEHTLVIGGTGMLAGATRELAGRSEILTAVARTTRSLRALAESVADTGCMVHEVALDWSDPEAFLSGLVDHIERTGPPSLVLAWLHRDELGPEVAQRVAAEGTACAFFQVRGSAAANPAAPATSLSDDPRIPANVTHREVILGFRLEGSGSRWLTHEEISRGVLAAIADPSPRRIVGTVTPWERRP